MTNKHLFRGGLIILAGTALCLVSVKAAPNKVVRVLQTNSAGDNVDVIDPVTNKVVGEIKGIEVNHGVCVAPDGTRIYVSDESASTLDVVDAKTLEVIKRIPLSGHPNNISVTPNGRTVYVAIAQARRPRRNRHGFADRLKTIRTKGTIHNPYVTPDGKYVVAGSIPAKAVSVVDTATNEVAWVIQMDRGIRPMTMSTNPDGSTKYLFVQLTDFNGFAVIDFASHEEIKRITNPALPPGKKEVPERRRSIARYGRHSGRQTAARQQSVEQHAVFVLPAGPEVCRIGGTRWMGLHGSRLPPTARRLTLRTP